MFSKEEILGQLREGASAAEIAQKMSDEINAAMEEYETEQKAQKKADQAKRAEARHIVSLMADYFAKYVGERKMNEKEIDEATDAIIELIDYTKDLKDDMAELFSKKVPKRYDAPSCDEEIDDEVLKRFLSSLS